MSSQDIWVGRARSDCDVVLDCKTLALDEQARRPLREEMRRAPYVPGL